jgi:protein TonB
MPGEAAAVPALTALPAPSLGLEFPGLAAAAWTASAAPVIAMRSPETATAVASPPVTPPRFDAAYLDNPAPIYPASAKRLREQGRVLLRVLVTAQGTAERIEVARTSGVEVLDRAALDAVRRWRFVPARQGDAAVAAFVHVPIVFSLAG